MNGEYYIFYIETFLIRTEVIANLTNYSFWFLASDF
jgi:hypothetical protein